MAASPEAAFIFSRPRAISERLGFKRPIFSPSVVYGRFGQPGLPWHEIVEW